MTLSYNEMDSPVGKLRLVANAAALVAVLWENGTAEPGAAREHEFQSGPSGAERN